MAKPISTSSLVSNINLNVPETDEMLSGLDVLNKLIPTPQERMKQNELEMKQKMQDKQDSVRLFMQYDKDSIYLEDKIRFADALGLDDVKMMVQTRNTIDRANEGVILRDMAQVNLSPDTMQDNVKELVQLYEQIDPNEYYGNYAKQVINSKLKGIEIRSTDDIIAYNNNQVQVREYQAELLNLRKAVANAKANYTDGIIPEGTQINIGTTNQPMQLSIEEVNERINSTAQLLTDGTESLKKAQYFADNPLEYALSLYGKKPEKTEEPLIEEKKDLQSLLDEDSIYNLGLSDDYVAQLEKLDISEIDKDNLQGDLNDKLESISDDLGFIESALVKDTQGGYFPQEEQNQINESVGRLISDIESLGINADDNEILSILKTIKADDMYDISMGPENQIPQWRKGLYSKLSNKAEQKLLRKKESGENTRVIESYLNWLKGKQEQPDIFEAQDLLKILQNRDI